MTDAETRAKRILLPDETLKDPDDLPTGAVEEMVLAEDAQPAKPKGAKKKPRGRPSRKKKAQPVSPFEEWDDGSLFDDEY